MLVGQEMSLIDISSLSYRLLRHNHGIRAIFYFLESGTGQVYERTKIGNKLPYFYLIMWSLGPSLRIIQLVRQSDNNLRLNPIDCA